MYTYKPLNQNKALTIQPRNYYMKSRRSIIASPQGVPNDESNVQFNNKPWVICLGH